MQGILFKPWKIKAIADSPLDRLWQTRRVIKPQPIASVSELKEHSQIKGYWIPYAADRRMVNNNAGSRKDDCGYYPRYQPGETVYIKEAWSIEPDDRTKLPIPEDEIVKVKYIGGEVERRWGDIILNDKGIWLYSVSKAYTTGKWQSPMFMPIKLTRHFITVTDVRADRTKDITPEDCLKEGIIPASSGTPYTIYTWPDSKDWYGNPQSAYFALYDNINGKDAHKANFDWVYSFKKVGVKDV